MVVAKRKRKVKRKVKGKVGRRRREDVTYWFYLVPDRVDPPSCESGSKKKSLMLKTTRTSQYTRTWRQDGLDDRTQYTTQ